MGLCPPASNEVVSVVFDGSETNSTSVGELPETLRLLDLVGTDEDP